jgi:hypothetical protein
MKVIVETYGVHLAFQAIFIHSLNRKPSVEHIGR